MLNKLFYYTVKIYWFIFRPKSYGVKCVVKYDNEILMIKNSYGPPTDWMFPGGGINQGETAEDAVKREIAEEVSVFGINFRKIGEFNSTKDYKHDIVSVFVCDVQNEEFKIDPKEISEAKWFNINSLPKISEYSKKILSMLK